MIFKKYFEMTKEQQYEVLEKLVYEMLDLMNCNISVLKKHIEKELKIIKEKDWAIDFLIANEMAQFLTCKNECEFSCFGLSCCSCVAYVVGITSGGINPIKQGLIFERGFNPNHPVLYCTFGFLVSTAMLDEIFEKIKKEIPSAQLLAIYDRYVIEIDKISIAFYTSIKPFEEIVEKVKDTAYNKKLATFDEDYMHFLHFGLGYSYIEANEFRKLCGKNQEAKIDKAEFFSRFNDCISQEERIECFKTLYNDIKFTVCKATYLSAKIAIDEYNI